MRSCYCVVVWRLCVFRSETIPDEFVGPGNLASGAMLVLQRLQLVAIFVGAMNLLRSFHRFFRICVCESTRHYSPWFRYIPSAELYLLAGKDARVWF